MPDEHARIEPVEPGAGGKDLVNPGMHQPEAHSPLDRGIPRGLRVDHVSENLPGILTGVSPGVHVEQGLGDLMEVRMFRAAGEVSHGPRIASIPVKHGAGPFLGLTGAGLLFASGFGTRLLLGHVEAFLASPVACVLARLQAGRWDPGRSLAPATPTVDRCLVILSDHLGSPSLSALAEIWLHKLQGLLDELDPVQAPGVDGLVAPPVVWTRHVAAENSREPADHILVGYVQLKRRGLRFPRISSSGNAPFSLEESAGPGNVSFPAHSKRAYKDGRGRRTPSGIQRPLLVYPNRTFGIKT